MKRYASLALFALLPLSVAADQVTHYPYNQFFDGNVRVKSLTPNQCVATDADKKLVSSGGACGGGGGAVSSVTSSNPNLTASPTTGAVGLNFSNSPTFSSSVTSPLHRTSAVGAGSLSQAFQIGSTAAGGYSNLLACPSSTNCTVDGNVGTALALTDSSSIPYFTVDSSKDFSITGAFFSNTLTPGNCLRASTNGRIVDTGSACAAGGGAVSSVTAGPSANLTFAPTTGAVIGDIVAAPTFTGAVTALLFHIPSTIGAIVSWVANTGDNIILRTTGSGTVAGINANAFGLRDTSSSTDLVAINNIGELGAADLNGANLTPGNCLRATTGGRIIDTGSACGGAPSLKLVDAGLPGFGSAQVNAPASWAAINGGVVGLPLGAVISEINISCQDFNATDAAAGNSVYTPLSAAGLGGATFSFGIANGTFSGSAPFNLGSVVIPDSPQGGPWVTHSTSSITPYTVLAGDSLVVLVTAVSGTTTQWVGNCEVFIGT